MSDGMYGRNAMGIRDGWSLKSTMPSNMWDESEDKERKDNNLWMDMFTAG